MAHRLTKTLAMAALLTVCLLLLPTGSASGEDGSAIAIETLSYDPSDGLLAIEGSTSTGLVNIVVTGNGYCSNICSSIAENGRFNCQFSIGTLEPGSYIVVASGQGLSDTSGFQVLERGAEPISVSVVSYNSASGTISISGTATIPLVNAYVEESGPWSVINAFIVDDGSFSGTFYVGSLSEGTHTIVLSGESVKISAQFEVIDVSLSITDAYYDRSSGTVSFTGTSSSSLVNAIIIGDDYSSPIDACPVSNGIYSDSIYVGQLDGSDYRLVVSTNGASATFDLDTGGGIPVGTELSEDGKTLIRFTGSVGTYTLPASVEVVNDGAFRNCSIKEFVLDRDVKWEIMTYDPYPFESVEGLEKITISEGVTAIPAYLFAETPVTSLTIPSTVTKIGTKAFYHCVKLSELSFVDDSQITSIGSYSFSSNPRLVEIEFGSSADGCECIIGEGAFFRGNYADLYDGNRKIVDKDYPLDVEVDPEFKLVEIGSFSFARFGDSSDVFSVTNFNSDDGICIPSTVRDIGTAAFSWTREKTSGHTEPMNFTMNGHVSIDRNAHIGSGSDLTIVFAEGSICETIGSYAFAGWNTISRLDMSACGNLTSISEYAFAYSLSSQTSVAWATNLMSIGDYAMYSAITLDDGSSTIIPASVESVGRGALQFVKEIRFEAGSALKSIKTQSLSMTIDMRECHVLESEYSGAKVLLPVGVFDTNWNQDPDPSTPTASWSDGKLIIDDDTVAIGILHGRGGVMSETVLNATELQCSTSNLYFKEYLGNLYFKNPYDGTLRLVFVSGAPTKMMLDRVDGIAPIIKGGIIPSNVRELVVNEGVRLYADALPADAVLESVTFAYSLDNLDDLDAFIPMTGKIQFNVLDGSSESCLKQLSSLGEVYIGYASGAGTVYLPYRSDGCVLTYDGVICKDGTLSASVGGIKSGTVAVGIGCDASCSEGKLTVTSILDSYAKVVFRHSDFVLGEKIAVTFSGNGGESDGCGSVVMQIYSGTSLSEVEVPSFYKDLYRFEGWQLNGQPFDLSTPVTASMILEAKWSARNPIISLDETAAEISIDGDIKTGEVAPGSYTIRISEIKGGYEAFNWTINGVAGHSVDEPLTVEVSHDTVIGTTYRYHSSSSGLDSVSNRDLPTSEEILSMVKVFELGGVVDTSMSVWQGTASVPLIVDDKVYFRAGGYLYMAESDTGFLLRAVASAHPTDYYHQIGYGDGIIIDCLTGKAYDLDLNQMYVLPSSVKVTGVEYYEGYFYTSGDDIYRFVAEDEDGSKSSEVKELNKIATVENTYATYGFAKSIFRDGFIYRVIADKGSSRGIAAVNIETGETSRVWLESLRSMYLDDGWISYHDGTIYLPGYTKGLFGAVAKEGNSCLAYISVDGLEFGDEKSYTFDDRRFTSEFIVVNGTGYVNCGKTLYAFDMGQPTLTDPRTIESSLGHGSMTIDVSHIDEDGSPVYIYMIPYLSSQDTSTFCVIKDSTAADGSRVLSNTYVKYLPSDYNSQTVRADIDGRMVWYNDSGHIFSYTTSEKNPYFFFIDDGTTATWYEAFGRSPADALSSLGDDVISLSSGLGIATISGKSVSSPGLWALESIIPTDSLGNQIMGNLKNYKWVEISSLADSELNVNHYYIIRPDSNSGAFEQGTTFHYLEGGAVKDYSFSMNIGDGRKVVGVSMVRGDQTSVMRFYDGEELIDEIIGVVGTKASVQFPAVTRSGMLAQWKDSEGSAILSLENEVFGSENKSYYVSWSEVPSRYSLDAKTKYDGGTLSIEYELEGESKGVSMSMDVFVLCSDGRTVSRTVVIEDDRSNGSIEIDISNAESCYLKVRSSNSTDDVVGNYGNKLLLLQEVAA